VKKPVLLALVNNKQNPFGSNQRVFKEKELKQRLVFNPEGDDSLESRKIIGGSSTGIANLNSVKYTWASKLYKVMLSNFWTPEKVSLVDDRTTIKELTEDEMQALKNTLSFLIALDSMQTANLPKLSAYISAPEINAIFTLQEFQEQIHSQSYQYLLQELFPSLEREEIYNYWRNNPLLLSRNKKIAGAYQQFADNPTEDNFKKAIAADFALEGIYFYNGFQFFYQLASRSKLTEVAKMIQYIDNDEVTHVSFMNYLVKEIFDTKNEEDVKILTETLKEAADSEIEWGKAIYGDRILGISERSTEEYVKYLANQRAKLIGIGVIYKGFNVNPYQYLDKKDKRENFFETTVTEYSQSTSVSGWDDF
jgi:ribonucleoside-diphosphate reductase beta chain